MSLDKFDRDFISRQTIGALKAAAWEDAKGKLRGVASLSGQYPSSAEGTARWKAISECVETFIRGFEDDAFHEA